MTQIVEKLNLFNLIYLYYYFVNFILALLFFFRLYKHLVDFVSKKLKDDAKIKLTNLNWFLKMAIEPTFFFFGLNELNT